ncbi:MAG: hypothetical protein ACRDHG_05855 [Anaerolineales bacterium]
MGIFSKRNRQKPIELKDFISNTLTQLIDGISIAQEYAQVNGAIINPADRFPSNFEKMSRTDKGLRLVHIIEFDVAVTVAENKQLKGGIGIVVPELSLGYQGMMDNQKSSVSRVQFSIPIVLPTQTQV